jgi:transglutaminase-like putative cysteine protease
VQPTVLDRRYHPFDYSYTAVSRISQANRRDFAGISGLSAQKRQELSEYLQVPLEGPVKSDFQSYLEEATEGATGYYEKAVAIFESYSDFQYEIGFTDNVAVNHMREFLLETRNGDCTEFSNATAILGRMAGIPTRVVTGYLGANSLQTPAHMQGVASLQQSIPPLQDYSLQELKLVTTAHRHSWLQMYMPGYGWVDFDPTSYAIPPQGGNNPNNMDVVIPMIDAQELETARPFPWWFVGRLAGFIAAAAVIGVYGYRGLRMLYLSRVARGTDQRALRALYTLLLMRLSLFDYGLKPHSTTALEYAEQYPELQRFATLYTTLRFRERMSAEERDSLWRELREEYRHLITEYRSTGFLAVLKRVFSLRVLYY